VKAATNLEIIAEIGVNHDGDLDTALTLVDKAAMAGADTVKFQTFEATELATRLCPKAGYQEEQTPAYEGQQEMLRKLQLPTESWPKIVDYCQARGIGFLSTAFDIRSIEMLISLGQRRFKVPSGEITNLPYLRHLGRFNWPILLSTGMSTLAEVGDALEILETAGTEREQITVLHCTSAYPTPLSEVNLRAIGAIGKTFNVKLGYSDHTLGAEAALGAVAIGCGVIEKHITLDNTCSGPDHAASLAPDQFAAFVSALRRMVTALGDGIKQATPTERKSLPVARRSIIARTEIKKGTIFSEQNLATSRPGDGLSPLLWDEVLGQTAQVDFQEGDLIQI